MNYEQKYKEALEKLQEALAPTEDGCKISGLTRDCLEYIFPELKENDDEKIRKEIIAFLRSKNGYMTPDEDWDFHNRWLAWLEKQGEQTQLDYEHADIPQKDFAPIEHKMLYADEIEWFRVNGWNSHTGNPINELKQDFGL